MPADIIIIRSDGSQTNRMPQATVEKYLGNLIEKDRLANLKQSLNDVTGGKGKATTFKAAGKGKGTSHYTINGQNVLHASSGNGQKSVSLFFYRFTGVNYIFAMGEHEGSDSYRLCDFGQDNNPTYKKNVVLDLNAKIAI